MGETRTTRPTVAAGTNVSWGIVLLSCSVATTIATSVVAWRLWRKNRDLLQRQAQEDSDIFPMRVIGTVSSPFPQRAGCPRQGGSLVPHTRSRIILDVPKEMVDQLETYSHIWIVFRFHLNPRGKARDQKRKNPSNSFTATKIKPPRANGQKIGVLATRSPHRPNPVGLSLAFLERITTVTKPQKRKRPQKKVCLVVRGLDLVDGTPIYDIKPYVPWDLVMDQQNVIKKDAPLDDDDDDLVERMKTLRVPDWVSTKEDALANVVWSDAAIDSLRTHVSLLQPLYEDPREAQQAIAAIVAQDPRALHDGRGRASPGEFEFTFGELRVRYKTQDDERGTGAPTTVISSVERDTGDLDAQPGSYPHNLALRRLVEQRNPSNGKKLNWANPVREGITDGLWALQDGSVYKPGVLLSSSSPSSLQLSL